MIKISSQSNFMDVIVCVSNTCEYYERIARELNEIVLSFSSFSDNLFYDSIQSSDHVSLNKNTCSGCLEINETLVFQKHFSPFSSTQSQSFFFLYQINLSSVFFIFNVSFSITRFKIFQLSISIYKYFSEKIK